MKTLLLCLALGISLSASAQKIRFTDTSNQWVYIRPNDCLAPIYFDYFSYGYNGDTVVNGTTYQKLYHNSITPILTLIREDTLARKVYIKHPFGWMSSNFKIDTSEHILYDFTMSIGDTLKFDLYDTSLNTLVQARSFLLSIDSVLVAGSWHLRQHFGQSSSYPFSLGYYVIEGIGAVDFNPIAPVYASNECPPIIICFSNRGVLPSTSALYQNNTSCYLGVRPLDTEREKISITPNPITTSAKVILPHTITKGRITIYSHTGQIVYTKQVGQLSEMTVNDVNYPSGLYMLEVYDEIERIRSFTKVVVAK